MLAMFSMLVMNPMLAITKESKQELSPEVRTLLSHLHGLRTCILFAHP